MNEHNLVYWSRPWTTNAERSMHMHARAKLVKEWREAFAILAHYDDLPTPMTSPVVVYVMPILRDKRGQDVGACLPAVKAAIDGLVDYGLFPDDTPQHVSTIVFCTPELSAGRDGLAIRLVHYTEEEMEG